MTDEQILIKAVEKALANGWKRYFGMWKKAKDIVEVYYEKRYKPYIFDHDFAKAFWGDAPMTYGSDEKPILKMWQYHLQQMVLEPEPLKYLEKFL